MIGLSALKQPLSRQNKARLPNHQGTKWDEIVARTAKEKATNEQLKNLKYSLEEIGWNVKKLCTAMAVEHCEHDSDEDSEMERLRRAFNRGSLDRADYQRIMNFLSENEDFKKHNLIAARYRKGTINNPLLEQLMMDISAEVLADEVGDRSQVE